jgi:hypothetical protein
MYLATSALAASRRPQASPMREAPAFNAQASVCGLHSAQSTPFES